MFLFVFLSRFLGSCVEFRSRHCDFFHLGTPSSGFALPTPSSRHFWGGLTPLSASLSQICFPRLSHLRCLSSASSGVGVHLLFRIRLIASGVTPNCVARTGVENWSGYDLCSARIPSIVSGDSKFRFGAHAWPASFFFIASLSSFQWSL